MQNNNSKYIRQAGFGGLLCLAAAAAMATVSAQALTIDEGMAVNVTPSQFGVFVRTSEPSTSWVDVYADAAGTIPLAGEVGMEVSPVHTGDPLVTTNYYRRAGIRAIQEGARSKSLALHRVSGCTPNTTYYFRISATNETASAQWPEGGALEPVTTELANEFLVESRQLLLDLHPSVFPPSPIGAVGILDTAGADYPIASFAGDGGAGSQIYFDLSGLFADDTHANLLLTGSPLFEITLYGQPEYPDLLADFTVAFSNAAEVAMAQSGMLIGTFVLDIRSVAGQAVPAVGLYTNTWGTVLACSITNALVSGTTTQHVSTGWAVTGSDPGSGSNTMVSITITNDAVLTWNWKTKYWLDTGAGDYGQVDEPDQWVDAGSVVTLNAQPDLYYHTDSWSGDVLGTTPSGDQLEVPMTQARAIMALFAENTTGNGVPQRWLYEQGFTNAWETAGLLDQDGDGMLTWEEWVAGTSPTNQAEVLLVDFQTAIGDAATLVWPSVSNRVYKVWRSTNLMNGFRQVSGKLPATPPANIYREPTASGQPAYYRISVERR